MKIPLFSVAFALCLLSLGCEMHVVQKEDHHAGKDPKASELQKALSPEPANPAPPTFFSTPQPQ